MASTWSAVQNDLYQLFGRVKSSKEIPNFIQYDEVSIFDETGLLGEGREGGNACAVSKIFLCHPSREMN